MFSMDDPNISLGSLYSMLIDTSFDKLDLAQLDDFRKILILLLNEFSNQCKDSGLPTKELDMLRAFLSFMDLFAKAQNNISGQLEENASLDPASNYTSTTLVEKDVQGQSNLLADEDFAGLPTSFAAGSSSRSTGNPIVLASGSAPQRDFWREFDASSLEISIQSAQRDPGGLLMLGEPEKFATVQEKVIGKLSSNGPRLTRDVAAVRQTVLLLANAFGTGGALRLKSFIEVARSDEGFNSATASEGAQIMKGDTSDSLIIWRAVDAYQKHAWAQSTSTDSRPSAVKRSLQFIHLADFSSAYQQCRLDLSDQNSELHRTFKHEGWIPSAHGDDSKALNEYLIHRIQGTNPTQLDKRRAKGIRLSWNNKLIMGQAYGTFEKAFTKGILILLPNTTIKQFRNIRQDILEVVIPIFSKEIPSIKIICEQITDYIVDPILRGQKPGFVRMGEKNTMPGKDFGLADLVEGLRSRSPKSSAPGSGPTSFAGSQTRLSGSRNRGNLSSASLPGKHTESDGGSESNYDSQADDDPTEDGG